MRKRKRALNKLKSARRQATSMAENADMSERQKVKVSDACLSLYLYVDDDTYVFI